MGCGAIARAHGRNRGTGRQAARGTTVRGIRGGDGSPSRTRKPRDRSPRVLILRSVSSPRPPTPLRPLRVRPFPPRLKLGKRPHPCRVQGGGGTADAGVSAWLRTAGCAARSEPAGGPCVVPPPPGRRGPPLLFERVSIVGGDGVKGRAPRESGHAGPRACGARRRCSPGSGTVEAGRR